MTQKNDFFRLSTKAFGLYMRLLLAKMTVCRKPEIMALCPEKRSAVETMIRELIAFELLQPLPEAPGRKSAYLVLKKDVESLLSSYNDLTTNNEQQINKESAAENQHMPKLSDDYQQICADYQLPFAFLAEQIAVREKTISAVTPEFVRGLLDYAKVYSNKNYSGFVRTLFRSPTFFLPQFATIKQPVAQESGYTPRTSPQAVPERQAAPSIAPPVATPPRAAYATTGAWNTSPVEDLRKPLKEEDVMQQHYAKIAAPLTENQAANEAQALRDLKSSLNAIVEKFTKKKFTCQQAQETAQIAFRNFIETIPAPTEQTSAELLRIRQKAAETFQERDAVDLTVPSMPPAANMQEYMQQQFTVAEIKEKQRMRIYGRINAHRRDS